MSASITAEGLGKMYRLGQAPAVYKSLRDLGFGLRKEFGRVRREEFWALRDVSFELSEGEVLGVIGRNGAGKSTLLKILSRIVQPTEGTARVRGTLGSLLEVGAGFHPELTGRENVYLNAAILGMSRRDTAARFDSIVEFAEVERFIDTPVKRYSSGMYVRLAFAVAAHLDPDILIVDEVLAVGDAAFQRKCLERMETASGGGRTVLFVSHNLTAIQALCTRCLLMEGGHIVADGRPSDVIHTYTGGDQRLLGGRHWEESAAPRSSLVALRGISTVSTDGTPTTALRCDGEARVRIEYDVLESGHRLGTTLIVRNSEGVAVLTSLSNVDEEWHGTPRPEGRYVSTCTLPSDLLAEDEYTLSIVFWSENYQLSFAEQDVLRIALAGPTRSRGDYLWRMDGVVSPVLEWHTERGGAV